MKMKKVLGGIAAAAMMACLVPVSGTAMAADSSCSVNFEVNGAIVEYADGVKPGATCDVSIAKAVSILGDTLSVPEGKAIDHWTLNGTRVYTGAPISAEELQGQTLVASLKDAPTYNFIVHTNGGEIVDGENAGQLGDFFYQFKEGETFLNKLPKLSKLDFVFKGWTYENGKAVKATDKATANTEVFAKWEPAEVDPGMQVKTFTLTVSTNGGEIASGEFKGQAGDVQYTVGQNEKLGNVLPKVTSKDLVFKGWSYDKAGQSKVLDSDFISADTHVYAQWEPAEVDPGMQVKTFILTVSTNGGEIASGEFKGWSGDVQYTVAQNDKLGNVLPKVTRKDFVLKGWTYDAAGQSKVLDSDFISANTQVYAQWEPAEVDPGMQVKTFTLTVSTNGGEIASGEFAGLSGDVQYTVAQNEKLGTVLPKVNATDLVFKGWSYDKAGYSKVLDSDFISADTHVYAQWEPAEVDPGMQVTQYNVVYNLNGGHFKGSSQVGDYSVQVAEGDTLLDKLPSSKKIVKKGYKFVGWVYSETGKRVKATDTVNGNIYKVVAKWQKKAWWEFPWWEFPDWGYPWQWLGAR